MNTAFKNAPIDSFDMVDLSSDTSSTSSDVDSLPHDTNVVLVTGGAGFIGSHTVDKLLERGDKVIIIDNMNDYYNPVLKSKNLKYLMEKYGTKRCVLYVGDITNRKLVHEIFETEKPNLICHLAARAGVRASIDDPFTYLQANIEGTVVLLEEIKQKTCRVDNFVFASSSSVYGNSTKMPLSETDAIMQPISPYAATKTACEALVYSYSHMYNIKSSGLRFFTVYGPRGRPDMAVFKFIDRIYNKIPIEQYGDGSTFRDYTFVEDIVSGVIGALDNPMKYEIYNLGNGNPVNLSNMISIIERALQEKAVINVLPKQPGDVDMTYADISKASEMLNYYPLTSLEIGLFKTVQWYLRDYIERGVRKPTTDPEYICTKQKCFFFRSMKTG